MADEPQLIYPYVLDGSTALVDAAYTRFTAFTNQAWALATSALNDLGNYTVPQIQFNAAFNPQIALDQFPSILAPVAPTLDAALPPAPSEPPLLTLPPDVAIDAPPVDTTVAPQYSAPAYPTLVSVDDPGNAPVLNDVSLPTAPVLDFPVKPDLLAINLPAVPTINYPTFQGERPVFNAPLPVEDFAFTPQAYVSDLLDRVRSTLGDMMSGEYVLPAAVAKALRDRATLEADNEQARTIENEVEQFSARGFEEPGGVLAKRLRNVRSDAAMARAGINRDIYVQDQQVALENLRTAVQMGVSLEGQLMQLHTSEQQMALDAAKYAMSVQIDVFNAEVTAFNAQVSLYQADASVFRDLIAAEQTKVDLYKALLEGEQIKGQLNETTVRLYTAQLQAVETLVDVYKSQLEAVNQQIAINTQKLDVYRTRVSVMAQQVQAQTAQIEGYRSRVEAETAKAQFYSASVSAYASRVAAYRESQGAKIDAARLQLDSSRLRQDAWAQTITLYTARVNAVQAQLDTIVKSFGMQSDIYKSKAQVATAAAEANNRAFQLNLAEQQAVVDTALKNAELQLKQIDAIAQITSDIKKAIAQVAGQLAASSMSAVSFHAGTNYSGSMSLGYNLGLSFSGSLDQ